MYAGHQIEAFDYVALDCISDIDSPEGQSLLQEYKRCRQWYQVYLQQNQEDLRRNAKNKKNLSRSSTKPASSKHSKTSCDPQSRKEQEMNNKTLNPTTLFGKNGAGTPWEEAIGAKNSKRDMEKLKKYFFYSHLLKALAVVFLGLAVISFFGVLPLPNVYWDIGVAILFFILMAGSICIADDIVSPAYSSWDREYLHNDGDGVWGRRDPASEFTNFSVPALVSVEEYDGGTVMFVNALYRWEGIRMLSPCYIHPDPESLRIPYGSILVSEYINLGNETLEEEYKKQLRQHHRPATHHENRVRLPTYRRHRKVCARPHQPRMGADQQTPAA